MNADSLSFFEENFVQYYEKFGEEKARKKIRFMYDRMSDNAKQLSKNIKYSDKKLNLLFKEETSDKSQVEDNVRGHCTFL